MIAARYSYVDLASRFHSLSPISKALWLVCANTLALILPDPAWLGLLFLSIFAVGLAARLGLRRLLNAMRPLRLLILFLLIFPVLVVLPGLGALGPNGSPSALLAEGIAYGVTITLRFGCIIYAAEIFLMTTKTKDFVYSMTKLGLPYRYGFMLITVFRLIPSLEVEVGQIRYAQMARGLMLEKTGLLRRYGNFMKYTVRPILISSLRKGIDLATSMDSACFGIYEKRTYLEEVNSSRTDYLFSSLILLSTVAILYASFTGGLPVFFSFSEAVKRLFFPSG